MINARNLRKAYGQGAGRVQALNGVGLSVAAGELVAICGPSGSGKSTLLHILGCLVSPDQGDYRLAGEDVVGLGPDCLTKLRNRRVGFVFQAYNLLPRVSVLENVEMPLLYAGRSHAKKAAVRALRAVGLGDCLRCYPDELASAQRQRVTVARAMVSEPAVILADEPTGNLDSHTGLELMQLFAELNVHGQTIVIATHDPQVAAFGHRRFTMRDGLLVEGESC